MRLNTSKNGIETDGSSWRMPHTYGWMGPLASFRFKDERPTQML